MVCMWLRENKGGIYIHREEPTGKKKRFMHAKQEFISVCMQGFFSWQKSWRKYGYFYLREKKAHTTLFRRYI